MRYSATTGCFYPEWGNYGDTLPADVVTVPAEDFELAINRPASKKVAVANGRIVLVDRPEYAKEQQLAAISATFAQESTAPVTVARTGKTYKGGEGSARAIKEAADLAQELGETEVMLVDVNDVPHALSFADAKHVAAQVGKAFRDAYFKMKIANNNLK